MMWKYKHEWYFLSWNLKKGTSFLSVEYYIYPYIEDKGNMYELISVQRSLGLEDQRIYSCLWTYKMYSL